jgi:DNA-binding response OmpR family regulator
VSSTKKVLVVEDDVHARNILTTLLTRDVSLRHLNIEPLQASDGEEGLEQFHSHHPDLVITDLLMPRLNGFKMIEAIRADTAGKVVPILVTTAVYRDPSSIRKLEQEFRVQVQPKPFLPNVMARTVRKLLRPAMEEAPARPAASKGIGGRAQPAQAAKRPPRPSLVRHVLGAAGEEDDQATSAPGDGRNAPAAEERPQQPPRDEHDARQTAPARPDAAAPLWSGALSEVGLPRLLVDLLERQATGSLDIRRGKIRKVIHVVSGHPVFVQSNMRSETLGQMLVRRGKISAEQHARALSESQTKGIKYG